MITCCIACLMYDLRISVAGPSDDEVLLHDIAGGADCFDPEASVTAPCVNANAVGTWVSVRQVGQLGPFDRPAMHPEPPAGSVESDIDYLVPTREERGGRSLTGCHRDLDEAVEGPGADARGSVSEDADEPVAAGRVEERHPGRGVDQVELPVTYAKGRGHWLWHVKDLPIIG
ncbi:hypothetical protein EBO15_30000 [Actinomadura harenae]|uniref:Uncharacterized protein n=1 Tax=Actinomadura harenae TaxID=2483351 RepID=A0A3M2LPF8_9ACTN|nr:hypothetical protein EBO15_30000 [Actinomadura harenae]